MLRDPLHKTLTERRGHSAVEYAIVLGLVTLIVAGGVAWLGALSIRMLSPLAGQTTGPAPASPAARAGGESPHPVGQLFPDASRQAAERTAPATLAMLAFALGIVGLGYFLLMLQRRVARPWTCRTTASLPILMGVSAPGGRTFCGCFRKIPRCSSRTNFLCGT